ncbi:TrmB family transcriptional regulator [Oceanirhabdus sp. W0125-5]|uniref:TrmB family transcriptional regulator n=1 Tax=Oceanirhabdus sp. W0125-5 TaxID=2999116 RepID=UPI0022F2CBD6|nr:helix-turn-helix domain-containing protein [Oceanirhabdus sp. W0125-5]WBW97052.1 helix-turn-helix domain-containing protein [Oceanirhabdus sp. W0125-5]
MNDNLIKTLEQLNFNKIEAKVYIVLLQHNELNGSQIAKIINSSRSSVYLALNNLYNRGIVYLIPGDTNMYRAENPDSLIQKMKASFEETTSTLKDELLQLKKEDTDKKYYNLNGTKNFINKAKELLLYAEKEVYINTCLDLQIFKEEFDVLSKRGVRIIVFTYANITKGNLPIELYKHEIRDYDETKVKKTEIRLMMVIDFNHTLICSTNDENVEMTGTFTENQLLANIVAEHIHHDIYLLKLKEKHKKELIDDDIKLNSLLEKRDDKISLEYKCKDMGE